MRKQKIYSIFSPSYFFYSTTSFYTLSFYFKIYFWIVELLWGSLKNFHSFRVFLKTFEFFVGFTNKSKNLTKQFPFKQNFYTNESDRILFFSTQFVEIFILMKEMRNSITFWQVSQKYVHILNRFYFIYIY